MASHSSVIRLRALYDFAHEIIVVEGATLGRCEKSPRPTVILVDGTLAHTARFQSEGKIPDNKLIIS